MRPFLTPSEAAGLLAKAWAADQGAMGWVDPVTLEALAWALAAQRNYLEATWEAWSGELEINDWAAAWDWLDTVVIGGIAER